MPSVSVARIRRVASRPSSSGIRMSMRITSGCRRAAWTTASRPLLASATTSMSGSSASSSRKPARTIDWSSTTSTRMVIGRHRAAAAGHGRGSRRPGRVRRTSRRRRPSPARGCRPDRVPARRPSTRLAACAVVAHLEPQLVGLVGHRDLGRAGAGVLEAVGQPLLHDAVRRQVEAGGQGDRARPATWRSTAIPAAPYVVRRARSRSASPGCGASSSSSPSSRIALSNRRISARAVRPASSTLRSASRSAA